MLRKLSIVISSHTPPYFTVLAQNSKADGGYLFYTELTTAVWFPASPGGSGTTAWQSFLMVFWLLPPNLVTC